MKREDITKHFPEATKEQIDALMAIHGADVTAAKGTLTDAQAKLAEANKELEALRKAKEDGDRAAASLTATQAELASLKAANAVREMRDKVAAAKKIPASLLTAETEEDCGKQADAILAFAGSAGRIPDPGESLPKDKTPTTRDSFAAWITEAAK